MSSRIRRAEAILERVEASTNPDEDELKLLRDVVKHERIFYSHCTPYNWQRLIVVRQDLILYKLYGQEHEQVDEGSGTNSSEEQAPQTQDGCDNRQGCKGTCNRC